MQAELCLEPVPGDGRGDVFEEETDMAESLMQPGYAGGFSRTGAAHVCDGHRCI